ncbi:MAG: hypothetical protein SXA11_12055 [Cyanobacteriota bacterium]|nr:hypothetical protein [Cyanobacteriota bacterium]
MKFRTKRYAETIREALLSLSDIDLYNIIHAWIERISENISDEEIADDIRFALGYKLESCDTFFSYKSWDDFVEAEPDCEDIYLIAPSPLKLRRYLEEIDLTTFYHQIVFIAGEALGGADMGWPPSTFRDGYEFLENLAVYLREDLPQEEDNNNLESFWIVEPELSSESWLELSTTWRDYEEKQFRDLELIGSYL